MRKSKMVMNNSMIKHLFFFLSICVMTICGTAKSASFLTLPNGSILYSSGINIDAENKDNSYKLISLDGGSVNYDVFMAGASYLSSNTTESAWISPFAPHEHIGDITLSVETTVDLTGIDLENNVFYLSGYWVSDNRGLDILVNGVPTGQTNNGDLESQPSSSPSNSFTISSATGNFVAGLNRIEFLWGNGGAGGADPNWPNDPTHVRIELNSYMLSPCINGNFDYESGNFDDVVLLQAKSPSIVGAGASNDVYIFSPHLLTGGERITLSDAQGSNLLQLAVGLSINQSEVASNSLRLTLSNGAQLTVLGADTFQYDIGGNASAGIGYTPVSFAEFAQETLGVTVPINGGATGEAVVIERIGDGLICE